MRLTYNSDQMIRPSLELPAEAVEQLRINIRELMAWRKLTQGDLAALLDKDQPWLSRRMSGKTQFLVEDLDRFAAVFRLTPHELLRPGFGKWERRRGERRLLRDRRMNELSQSKGVTHGQSIDVSDPVVLAETLTTIAEAIQRLAAALLTRYPAITGDSPSGGNASDRVVRSPRSHPGSQKAG